jgi:hypothetical protein
LYIMDVFFVAPQLSPITLAKIEKATRQRASGNKDYEKPKSDW